MGIISACMRNGPSTECSRRKVQADRQKCRSTYYFMSRFVCAKAFVRLVGISPDKLYALAKHCKTGGPVPRQLRAGGRKNNTASLALVDTERVHFKQYAEDHAVSLPGRVPGFKRDDIRLLPSSCPKSQVCRLYEGKCQRCRTPRRGCINVQEVVVGAVPLYCCCQTCDGSLLALSAEQHQHLQECKSDPGGKR